MNQFNFTIFDVLRGLKTNWWTVAKCVIGVTFLVMLITLLVPKTYSSKAKLLVNLGRENVALDPSTSMGNAGVLAMPLSRESEINSVAEMMNNRELFRKVVSTIGADRILNKESEGDEEVEQSDESEREENLTPVDRVMGVLQNIGVISNVPIEEKAEIEFRKSISIESVEKSNIVTVEYECHDPRLAQEVVRTFIDSYVRLHSHSHRAEGSFRFLQKEMEKARDSLTEKQIEFEKFKRSTGLLDIVQQRSGLISRLQSALEQADQVETDKTAMEQEIKKLEENLKSIDMLVVQEEISGSGNRTVDQLNVELSNLRQRLKVAKRTSLDRTKSRQKTIQIQIDEKIAMIEKMKKEKETRKGVNKVYTSVKSNLEAKKPQLAALKEKEIRLAAKIDELRGMSKTFGEREKKYHQLQTDELLATQAYKRVAANFQQAKIDLGRQREGISNISEPQSPTVNHKPVSPNKLLNLIGGILLGGMLGCGLAVLKEYRQMTQEDEEDGGEENNNIASDESEQTEEDRLARHVNQRLRDAEEDMELDDDYRSRPSDWNRQENVNA